MPTLDTSFTVNSSSPLQGHGTEPSTLHYAFLVHSQKTLTQNLPPRVDNKLLARQKRRRTSPEDHAILEAEYCKNPKPDKIARASIVGRVALGEKEVQIWFQNRRQNDRRKSKPLEPDELVESQTTAQHGEVDDYVATDPQSSTGSDQSEELGNAAVREADTEVNVQTSSDMRVDGPPDGSDGVDTDLFSSQNKVGKNSSQTSQSKSDDSNQMHGPEEEKGIAGSDIQLNGKKRPFSKLDNARPAEETTIDTRGLRTDFRSPPSLRISMSFDGKAMVRKEGEATPSPPKARSAVRISLSSDGEALIRTEDEPSPSKNRIRLIPARTPRLHGLRRSTSAVNFGTPRSGLGDREGGSKAFGRSRDARTWELYCDTDARSALSGPLNSQNGSNVATPRLYQAGSHNSLARPSFSKPSVLSPRPDLLNHRPTVAGSGEKRRKLARTVSSLGRLESVQKLDGSQAFGNKSGPSKGHDDLDWDVGDSDKENWVPGTNRSNSRRHRKTTSQVQRPALQETGMKNQNTVDDLAFAANRKRGRGFRGARVPSNRENGTVKLDAEVAAFMSGSGPASREEDLDCIQGLLSLSQGAWR